ncbi:MAG: hypothetical protein DKT66_07035 [Candidatus Melainabacteria bacterium]|nr:MAG: hypothetical protein DKT66_07035 [Candidatus Melainabacteria bacterium]
MDNEESLAVEISPEAQKFLRNHIQSVWQLELILFMKEKGNALSVTEIASKLYSNPRVIETALTDFVRGGIIKEKESQNVYAFDPDSVEMTNAIEQAGKAYANKRLSVINFIFSRTDGDKKRA